MSTGVFALRRANGTLHEAIVLAVGVALWAVATTLTGLAGGVASILLWRLMLGLGESVTFPSWQLILARHAPEQLADGDHPHRHGDALHVGGDARQLSHVPRQPRARGGTRVAHVREASGAG